MYKHTALTVNFRFECPNPYLANSKKYSISVTMAERNGAILYLEERFLREAIKAGVKKPEEKTKKFRSKMELLREQTATFSRPSLVDKQYLIQNQSPVCWYVSQITVISARCVRDHADPR